MVVPFVGREAELAVLMALVRDTRRNGLPTAALVTGEPGSGKTSLLAELLGRAGPVRSFRIAGFEPMQSVPLAAAGDILRHLATSSSDGAVLDRLVFGGGAGEDRDPLRIFEVAHRSLVRLGRVLIAIDDLQWVDPRSVALVHYLLAAAADTRHALTVLAVSRPAPAAAAFRAGIEADLPTGRRALIDLGSLPLEDGRSLVRSIDKTLDDATATDLWRKAGGSPFWLEALARTRTSGDPSRLIGERLRDLSADASTLLAAISVGARPFAEEEAGTILDWLPDRVRHATGELVARGLAMESGGTTRVAHDLIREAAASGLPAAARRRLHGRLATSIEAAAGEDLQLLVEALAHRDRAGLPATDLAMRVLASPRRRLLGAEDLRRLATIADAVEPADASRLALDRAIAILAAELGEQELALERWLRVADASGDPGERQRAQTEAARAAYRLGHADVAHRHIDLARSAGGTGSPAAAAVELDALEAEVQLWLDHETSAGSATAERAMAGARQLAAEASSLADLSPADRSAYLAALIVAGDAALQEDHAEQVIQFSRAILEVVEGLDDDSRVTALIRTGFALRPLGRTVESAIHYRTAWEVAKRLVLPSLTVEAGHGLARGLRELGRLAEAREIALETSRLEARIRNSPRRWGSAASIVHSIELSLGDPATALRALRSDADAEPDPHYRLAIHQTAAAWQARYSGVRAAADVEARLAEARADAALARCPRCSAELSVVSAELLARVGRVGEARSVLREWDRAATRKYLARELWRMRAAAAIATADADRDGAVAILERYAEQLEQASHREELVWARIDMGRALAPMQRSRAIAALAAAAELADEIGATSQGRLASQALRTLGVRAWRRGTAAAGAGLASLSEREREIAALVADGRINREIAEALVLSPKTVERHVTNVLAKLGLRNRTELASLVRSDSVRDLPDE